jgi:hypothetical protein
MSSCEGVLNLAAAERLNNDHRRGREKNRHILWVLMVLEDWQKRWRA